MTTKKTIIRKAATPTADSSQALEVQISRMHSRPFAEFLVKETFKLIDAQQKSRGETYAKDVTMYFLTQYIASALYYAVAHKSDAAVNAEEYSARIAVRSMELKIMLQDAIASGYETALANMTGKNVEHVCLIKTISKTTARVSS